MEKATIKVNPFAATPRGRKALGYLLKRGRESRSWTIDDLVYVIRENTGYNLSKSTVSQIERGNCNPNWETIALLADVGYIKHPLTGNLLNALDLFMVTCERLSPSFIIELQHQPRDNEHENIPL